MGFKGPYKAKISGGVEHRRFNANVIAMSKSDSRESEVLEAKTNTVVVDLHSFLAKAVSLYNVEAIGKYPATCEVTMTVTKYPTKVPLTTGRAGWGTPYTVLLSYELPCIGLNKGKVVARMTVYLRKGTNLNSPWRSTPSALVMADNAEGSRSLDIQAEPNADINAMMQLYYHNFGLYVASLLRNWPMPADTEGIIRTKEVTREVKVAVHSQTTQPSG